MLDTPDDARGHSGLSQIAEEFRVLDERRRREGLSHKDVDRYHSLFSRLSDALASGERKRRMDSRQFLRVPFDMQVVLRTTDHERLARCTDFGGGGCAINYNETLRAGDELVLDGVIIRSFRYPLSTRARVVWVRPGEYGLQFALKIPEVRDQIDRILYRVLDLFLHSGGSLPPRPVASVPRRAPQTIDSP